MFSSQKTMVSNINPENEIIKSFKIFRDEVSELYLPKEIQTVTEIPEPLKFYKNWVAPNIPLLIKGGLKNWPAVSKWSEEYLCNQLKDKLISVAVTPNGYADALTEKNVGGVPEELFVLPEERLMTMSDFFSKLNSLNPKDSDGIFYIQKQNSNLTEEFSELIPDIDEHLLWASTAFDSKPTAINLWIGDERAITSLHKDPFENIYCVVSGYKEFILLPPTDRPWLPYKTVSVGQYKETSPGVFEINTFDSYEWMSKNSDNLSDTCGGSGTDSKVPWIAIDPYHPNYEKYPLYKHASPIKVKVEEGDMFYMPSFWFHHVKQSHKCIAVNYWYDMSLDIKYAYFQLLENLTKCCSNFET